MKKQRTMKNQLFRIYTLLFLLLFLLTVTVSLIIMVRNINTSILETQKRIANTITVSIDGYFDDMNEFSTSLMNSDEFKQAVIEELPASIDNASSQTEILRRVYNSAYRMFEKGYRVGVATSDGVYIWLADQILVEQMDSELEIYDSYIGHGRPELYLFSANTFLSHIEGGERSRYADIPVLSLSRSINRYNHFAHPQAMLEVQVGLHEFEAFVENLMGEANEEHLQLTVYGADGSLLYGEAPISGDNWKENATSSTNWIRNEGNLEKWESVFSGNAWIRYQIPEAAYYQKLWTFLGTAIIVFLLMIVVMIYCTWWISRKVTRPLTELNTQLGQIDLTEPVPLLKVESHIQELNQISQTVSDLNTNLYHAMQQILLVQTAEMQSRLLALTSQMQPHFLYNTLAVIQSLSKQGENDLVCRMCSSLSQMLRYISAEQENGVMLYEEINFLKNYTMIMKERFPSAEVHIDIPLELMDVRVPKLIIQPLCENSFKYAGRNDVHIWVKGYVTDDSWRVRVMDSGPGFTKEKIEAIMNRCRHLLNEKETRSVGIDGMGLPNIYSRLALLYNSDFTFSIDEKNGVTIGGKRNAGKQQN